MVKRDSDYDKIVCIVTIYSNNQRMPQTSHKKNISVFCKSCTVTKAKCHFKKKCKFAHTIDAITPIVCKYGDACVWRELTCNKIHVDETKDEYAFRVGFKEKGDMIIRLSEMAFARMIVKKLSRYPPIDPEINRGAMIMKKWGWISGYGLGTDLQGIIEPVLPISASSKMINEKQNVKGPLVPVIFVKASSSLETSLNKLAIE